MFLLSLSQSIDCMQNYCVCMFSQRLQKLLRSAQCWTIFNNRFFLFNFSTNGTVLNSTNKISGKVNLLLPVHSVFDSALWASYSSTASNQYHRLWYLPLWTQVLPGSVFLVLLSAVLYFLPFYSISLCWSAYCLEPILEIEISVISFNICFHFATSFFCFVWLIEDFLNLKTEYILLSTAQQLEQSYLAFQ